jgi:cell division protein FtsN
LEVLMRFEIKGGGLAAILVAVTILSGAVFVLGLLAGYDVGRQSQLDTAQLATNYSLQPPPPSSAKPAIPANTSAANPPLETASARTEPPPAAARKPATQPFPMGDAVPQNRRSSQSATHERLASTSIPGSTPHAGPPSAPAANDNPSATSESETSHGHAASSLANGNSQGVRRAAASSPHRRPYNIQIEAAMDISGADEMMARLQKLGYASHLVPTEIAGQRWYKVEVGPYATAAEASEAEAELREKYDETYGRAAHSGAAEASADEGSEE